MVWIYLDDIFLVAQTPTAVAKHLEMMLADLRAAGMVINEKKSILKPTQVLEHLGFLVDLKQGLLSVPPGKLKMIQKELGKLLTHSTLSCRKMAAILGTTRSFLTAIPCLRAFTDQLVHFVKNEQIGGWDSSFPLPEALRNQVKEIKVLLDKWKGRIFQGQAIVRRLHSDSSQHAWAGVDLTSNQIVHEFWRTENGLHINVKELRAAINTVKSLAKKGEKVALAVDNSVTYAYLKNGGGRVPSLNAILRPFLKWCLENQIQLEITQVSSKEDLADAPSRWQMDRGDYTLNKDLFLALLRKMRTFAKPQVDMFASPGNHQLPKFVSRYPHWEAFMVNALTCPLTDIQNCYANPPWTLIGKWLNRLRENPHLKCMMIAPLWVSAPWWPLLLKLRVKEAPCFKIPPFHGMFQNCQGKSMRAPHWPLICIWLSGNSWRPNKSRLKAETFTWIP